MSFNDRSILEKRGLKYWKGKHICDMTEEECSICLDELYEYQIRKIGQLPIFGNK